MALSLGMEPVPLKTDADGVVRVGSTRVTLDTVVEAFNDGATAEEIVHQYPSIRLADVYGVIAYYLQHRNEIDDYLTIRREHTKSVRQANHNRFDPQGIRDRLLLRRPS